MDIPSLTAFLSVAECGSFSMAAEQLHLTQPAVSKRIASLEQQLGTPLFDRKKFDRKNTSGSRRTHLNEAGRTLLPKARQMLELMQDTRQQITNLKTQIKGPLRLATSHHIGLRRLPEVLKKFARTWPDVTLDIKFVDSEAAYELLHRGEVELGIITLAPANPEGVLSQKLWNDPLVFMACREHPLAQIKDRISPRALCQYQAVLPDPGTFTYRLVQNLFDQQGLPLQTAMSSNYLETIRMLTAIGIAWSLLPKSMLGEDLVELKTGVKPPVRELGYIRHEHRTLSNAARVFLERLDNAQVEVTEVTVTDTLS
ncbi:LysR family transcriptional regulator [Endozoicomonas montiporae]|uniref:LysR family transcriptional regulator n=2 Tax=Endozoicomonas montiporae TaxID=1027273 RepID=A0A081NAI4_9GAMM|nr:LysR family transcriptional regulator [Endozoicomonas montiporae]AMO56864.1 LysR family transcriptional regulator [Endozoicomonas montiporae CL-33]KEQ15457.1 LysR family transcriptional regulator [Endozoicomonas montiporae]